jgi:hypothetical protein
MAFGMTEYSKSVHCALCGTLFTTWRHDLTDWRFYCDKCQKVPALEEDDVIDAYDTLGKITLAATLMRILRIRETYLRDS